MSKTPVADYVEAMLNSGQAPPAGVYTLERVVVLSRTDGPAPGESDLARVRRFLQAIDAGMSFDAAYLAVYGAEA